MNKALFITAHPECSEEIRKEKSAAQENFRTRIARGKALLIFCRSPSAGRLNS